MYFDEGACKVIRGPCDVIRVPCNLTMGPVI